MQADAWTLDPLELEPFIANGFSVSRSWRCMVHHAQPPPAPRRGLDSRLTPSPDWGTLGDGADAASRPVLAPWSLQRKQRKEGSWALRAQAGRTVLAALLSFLLRSTR